MTQTALQEGQRLIDLIKDYRRTLEYFTKIQDNNIEQELSDFLISTRMIPNKNQMAQVMKNAVIEACDMCITQAQEAFDKL